MMGNLKLLHDQNALCFNKVMLVLGVLYVREELFAYIEDKHLNTLINI